MNYIILLALTLLSAPAVAQDSVDAHGFQNVPSDGGLHDPLRTWAADSFSPGSVAVDIVAEYAYQPVMLNSEINGTVYQSPLIEDMTVANLGAFYAPNEWLAITMAAPLILDTTNKEGLGLGDFSLAMPVMLLSGQQGGLAVIPTLTIPSRYDNQLLSQQGVSGGGIVALTAGKDSVLFTANAGVDFGREVQVYNLTGSDRFVSALAASWAFTDTMALRTEANWTPNLSKNIVPGSDSPAEITASLRGLGGDHTSWTLGASTALTSGTSAATSRVFLAANWTLGSRFSECDDCYADVMVLNVDEGNVILPEVSMDVIDVDRNLIYSSSTGKALTLSTDSAWLLLLSPPECPAVEAPPLVVIEGDRILLMEPVYFDFDKDTIRFPESAKILAALVSTLKDNPDLTLVEVGGHTDSRGSDTYNEDLSQRRMHSVALYLSEHGISPDRLKPVGFGERELLDDNCQTEECHQLNRRVEFTILDRSQ